SIRLLDLCLALGERYKARTRLETAVARLPENLALRARLADLYREESAHEPLASLLAGEARLHADPAERVQLLTKAAALYRDKVGDFARAMALYQQALELS